MNRRIVEIIEMIADRLDRAESIAEDAAGNREHKYAYMVGSLSAQTKDAAIDLRSALSMLRHEEAA